MTSACEPKRFPTMGNRKGCRWRRPFLLALEGNGDVRKSARIADVHWTTAYAARRLHPHFAAQWDAALAAFDLTPC